MNQPPPEQPGLADTLRSLGATVLAILQNRLELLTVELQEERIRLFDALLLAALVAGLAFFAVTAAVAALLIFIWDDYGVKGLLIVSVVATAGAAIGWWQLRKRLVNWPLFSATLAELKKDGECLKNKD